MKFNLYMLADQLKNYKTRLSKDCSIERKLLGICLLDKNVHCEEKYAYIVPKSKECLIKDHESNKNLTFIIVSKTEETSINHPDYLDILYIYSSKTFSFVQKILMEALTNLNLWETELMEAIMSQADLQEQMNIAVRYLKNPLALFDMSFSLLTWAGNMPSKITDPTWLNVVELGYNNLKAFPKEMRKPLAESLGFDQINVVPEFEKLSDNRVMMATLYNGGIPVACMAMNELCEKIDLTEYSYLEVIKHWMERSPVLLRHIGLAKNRGSKIFLRLIQGYTVNDTELSGFMRENGWRKEDVFRIYVIRHAEDSVINEKTFPSFLRKIYMEVPDLEMYCVENQLIAIDRSKHMDDNLMRLRPVLNNLCMTCGSSMDYIDCKYMRNALLQAEAAISYASEENPVVCYESIYLEYIGSLLKQDKNLQHLCYSGFLKFDNNDPWHMDLLKTLYYYFISGEKIAYIAEQLHIHRNTVLYRVSVIEELLGLQLESLSREEINFLRISTMILSFEYGLLEETIKED